ncbi:MAG: class I SAM-dependent methyltransferase [Pseudomonadales bacterium]
MPETDTRIIAIGAEQPLQQLAEELLVDLYKENVPIELPGDYWFLHFSGDRLCLSHSSKEHLQNIHADLSLNGHRFSSQKKLAHELLIKAIGGVAGSSLRIVDATAGLGTDALLMAAAGHELTMVEQSPVLAALLEQALALDSLELDSVPKLTLCKGDAVQRLPELADQICPHIVYLDPMFPTHGKSSLARKQLQALKELLPVVPARGEALLLETALQAASHRVVVKRPMRAHPLPGPKPGFSYKGKLVRYDCYAIAKL